MQELKKFFEAKDYKSVIDLIEADPEFTTNFQKLQYLVSANYYLSNFEESIKGIRLIEPFNLKMAYSMYIDTHISLGTNVGEALKCIDKYLELEPDDSEKNWRLFKKGQCLIAVRDKADALNHIVQSDLRHNKLLEFEKHYFWNSLNETESTAKNEAEAVNLSILKARRENLPDLAKAAFTEAQRIGYGEGEFYAAVVLAKDFKDNSLLSAFFPRSLNNTQSIYYHII